MSKPRIYAIDYGTSNSLLCAANESEIFADIPIDPSAKDPSILKSVLYTSSSDQWLFGSSAIDRYLETPSAGRIFKSLKRFLPDPTFKGTRVFTETLTVSDLIAKQLRFMRNNANQYFDTDVRSVVLGCPAVFSTNSESNQIAFDRLKLGAQAAGFERVEFCPEPIAAAYKFRKQLKREQMVAVADFGGGTSDFTILKMGPSRFKQSDVLSLGGLSIAGDKYDSAIMKDIVSPHFGSHITYRKPMSKNDLSFPKSLIRKMCSPADIVLLNKSTVLDYIKEARRYITDDVDSYKLDQLITLIEERQGYALFKKIEECKIELSQVDSTHLAFHYPEIDVEETIAKDQFEAVSEQFTRTILSKLDETIKSAGLTSDQIDIVCLTGGTANISSLRRGLEERFGKRLQLSERFHSVVAGLADRAQDLIG